MITKKTFKIPIYDFYVEVIVFDEFDEIKEKYPSFITGPMLGCTVEHIDCPRCKLIIPSKGMSTIIHEIEHVKNLVWKYIGYIPQSNNDEPDAYLMGYIGEEAGKVIRKHLALK